MTTEVLGSHMYITALKMKGTLPAGRMKTVLQEVVDLIGMHTGGLKPKIWTYPLPGGEGGVGDTVCQPLLESFIISDGWKELGHTYIILASCRRYSVQTVVTHLAESIGPMLDLNIINL